MTDKKNKSLPCRTKAEVNFLVLPYFSLDKDGAPNRSIEFNEIQQRGDETFEIVWNVIPHQKFGMPRDFERRLQRAVEHSISNLPRPISNPVPLPSFRELARIMGVACSGQFVERVKQGLTAMMMTAIMSKRSYYNKRKKAWLEEGFHLYDKIIFKGEELSDDQTADQTYVHFTSGYIDNLNAMYVRPIDFEYLKSLRPIASRLYELLGVKFYGHNEHIQYKYSTLCKLLPVRRQKSMSRSRQQLESAHAKLKNTGFLGSYSWKSIRGVRDDWYIRYEPGKRFFDEIKELKERPSDDIHPAPLVEAITSEQDIAAHRGGFDELDHYSNHDPVWSIFASVVKKYREFDFLSEDIEWFHQRVIENSSWNNLNLMEEIKNWGDWLNIEHRKKCGKKENKFPQSNFKGSLMNWLKQSLKAVKVEKNKDLASINQESHGRKGWDLPSDYRIDIM
jgi:hypothetical protein